MTPQEKEKIQYRVIETDYKFYIQKRNFFIGWNYDLKMHTDPNFSPEWYGGLISFMVIAFIVCLVFIFLKLPSISIFAGIVLIILSTIFILNLKLNKKLTYIFNSLKECEAKIDSLISNELTERDKKSKKIHYFFSQQQERAEKLKQLRKFRFKF